MRVFSNAVCRATTFSVLLTMASVPGALAANPQSQSGGPAKTLASQQDQAIGIGLGTGMVVGAIVGGPIGAAVAGVLGAVVGDNSVKHQALKQADETVATQAGQLQTLHAALSDSRQQQAQLQKNQQRWSQLQSAVQFTTGSAGLNSQYTHQLDALADVLRHTPGLSVELTGYADARGDQEYNLALSEQRAARVYEYLLEAGVNPQQIHTQAQGEAVAGTQPGDPEHHFFERKVVMQLHHQPDALTARQ